eukprot:TRINITY_DN12364_c1_g5_i1.p2 TRINITY_DN12364_c1_g5~~TRINITY_DN12364_c1_g5_i1.p2  ORF type:complete len:682 (+),score=123.78 TRINITY_DN12364_c1_g5_i1:2723-4768(+)
MACQFEIMRPWYLITLIVGLLAPIFNSQEVPVNTPIPGAFAKPFSVPIINKSTFNFDPESIFRPMIGFVHSIEDPFSMEALHRQASLDELMTSEIAADVLLLATDEPSQQDLTATMAAALANLTTTQRQFWTTHLHVANASVAVLNATWPDAEPLVSWLASWQTLTRTLSWHSNGIQESIPRLDGKFQFCNIIEWDNHSPSSPLMPYPSNGAELMLVKNACAVTKDLSDQFVLVDLEQEACSADEAAKAVMAQQARGVVIMAAPGSKLTWLGIDSFEDQGLWDGNDDHGFCSVIAANPSLRKAAQTGPVNLTYTTSPRLGAYFGLDHKGRYSEMGSPLNPTMALLVWHAQYLIYLQKLDTALAQPALVVPVFDPAIGEQASVSIAMPDVSSYADLELESRLSCEGSFDLDCDKWDHVHTVSVTCVDATSASTITNEWSSSLPLGEQDVQPSELGRWITPYRRRVGHWLTPAKQWLGQMTGAERCNFTLAASDNGHPWVFTLKLRFLSQASDSNVVQGHPFEMIRLFNTSVRSTFDQTYNLRPTLSVSAPNVQGLKAYISAIITGHGSMEFTPSEHIFEVNGKLNVSVSFMAPLDQDGCAKKIPQGVEPNGHGAIWFGRDGWCNGFKVEPWVGDVTSAIVPGQANTVRYIAKQYNLTSKSFEAPAASDGYMRVSSNMVFTRA